MPEPDEAAPAGEEPAPKITEEERIRLWNDYMIEGARYGDLEDVEEALANGGEVCAADDGGRTALHVAAANNHTAIMRVLLTAGANTEQGNSEGSTALHWACAAGALQAVELLLDAGANPAALNSADQVPLDSALENQAILQLFQNHKLTTPSESTS